MADMERKFKAIDYNEDGVFDIESDGEGLLRLFEDAAFRKALAHVQALAAISDTLQGLDLTNEQGRLEALRRQTFSNSLLQAVDIIESLLTEADFAIKEDNDG